MAQVLRHLPSVRDNGDPNILVGTETFDDAGVYRLTADLALVQTLDFFPPVVDDPFVYGQIAAANAISDIYAMGGVPKTALNLVGFPDDQLPLDLLGRILAGGHERVRAAGAALVGGHTVRDTEIKYGLSVTGIIDPNKIVTNAGAKPGDVLFLTKPLGTGFVTTAHKADRCPDEPFSSACESMVALNEPGAKAMAELGVRAATDITGFGLAGHANEMANGSGVTLLIHLESLPIFPGAAGLAAAGYLTRASKTNADFVRDVCREASGLDAVLREFLFDAQTSGGLLLAVAAERAHDAEQVLKAHGALTAARIGEVQPRREGVSLVIER
jgi:selenide,water dikinase